MILGPVLTREGGYAFDAWTSEGALRRSYNYRRIEDAYYARKAELRCLGEGHAGPIVVCNTVNEFRQAANVPVHPPDSSITTERRLPLQGVGAVEATARLGSRQAA